MTDQPFQLFTSHYKAFQPEWGTPVQISNGRPKYALPYPLIYSLPDLYPEWSLVKNFGKTVTLEQFRERYWAGLDALGAPAITQGLTYLAEKGGQSRLVLMCYERTPADCHRGDFAMWWERVTGTAVPEMTKTSYAALVKAETPTLF